MAVEDKPQLEKNGYVVVIYKPKAKAHVYLDGYDEEHGESLVAQIYKPVGRHVFETEAEAAKVALALKFKPGYSDCLVIPVNVMFEAEVDAMLK